jgi:hypothetical protein
MQRDRRAVSGKGELRRRWSSNAPHWSILKEMPDCRTEPRFGADQPVIVSVVTPIPGKIDSASKSGLRVTVSRLAKIGAVVEVNWDRVIVVGEVRYCQKSGPRKYSIGVKIMEIVGGAKLLQIKPNAA